MTEPDVESAKPLARATSVVRKLSKSQPPGGDNGSLLTFLWRYQPHAIVFFSSACIMVIELVAGRLIARHLGSSLYTWTSIIGVVLAGMSIGNYIGGRMADKRIPSQLLGWLFMAASMGCLSTLMINNIFARNAPLDDLSFPVRVFCSVLIIFILPALVLGTISPAAAKMALDRSDKVGATIGSVYAWGAVGSIVGTLSTGFWLIALLGTRGVVMAITLALAVVGLALGPRRLAHAAWVGLLVTVLILSQTSLDMGKSLAFELGTKEGWKHCPETKKGEKKQECGWYEYLKSPLACIFGQGGEKKQGCVWYEYPFAQEGKYQLVKVYDKTSETTGRELKVLSLDYLIHGYIDPSDPTHLEYGYERIYADLTHRLAGDKKQISAMFLGGGSYTLPRWLQGEYPKAKIDVAEIDPLVLEANHAALGLPRNTPINTILMDARIAVDKLPADKKYDLIYSDAFSDLSIPFHLTTLEFFQKLAKHMTPRGAVLQNIIDKWNDGKKGQRGGEMLAAHYNTLKQIFRHVYVLTTHRDGVGAGRETFVVVGTNHPMKISDWIEGHSTELTGSVIKEQLMASLVKTTGPRVLTDNDAPVENLLKPVVDSRN